MSRPSSILSPLHPETLKDMIGSINLNPFGRGCAVSRKRAWGWSRYPVVEGTENNTLPTHSNLRGRKMPLGFRV